MFTAIIAGSVSHVRQPDFRGRRLSVHELLEIGVLKREIGIGAVVNEDEQLQCGLAAAQGCPLFDSGRLVIDFDGHVIFRHFGRRHFVVAFSRHNQVLAESGTAHRGHRKQRQDTAHDRSFCTLSADRERQTAVPSREKANPRGPEMETADRGARDALHGARENL